MSTTERERFEARLRVQLAQEALARDRAELNSAIVDAHRAGVPQTQIAEAAGFTRAWIARLLKRNE